MASPDRRPDPEGTASRRDGGPGVSVGQNARAERERLGLSIRELARRLGVSASFLSQFELGQSQAAVSTLFSIARELNGSPDELLGHSVAPDKPTQKSGSRGANGRPPLNEYLAFQTGVRWRR